LKVLFSSGYSDDMLDLGTKLPPGDKYLAKPYIPAVLAKVVRQRLDGP